MRSVFLVAFSILSLFGIEGKAQTKTDSTGIILEPSLENLYYGNVNEVITKMLWIGEKNAIGFRYDGPTPKDLVLFDQQKLIVDSLSINQMFLDGYVPGSGRFTSINGLVQESESSFVVHHNYGSTRIRVNGSRFEVTEKKIESTKPDIDKKYLSDYRIIHLGRYSIGYGISQKKHLKSADFWVYDWDKAELEVYEDSKLPEESTNRYWSLKKTPETYSIYTLFAYNIIQTRDGFIFNLPLKNRFLKYSAQTGRIQGYTFPPLEKKSQAWFAFYDWELDRIYPVLDTGKEYRVYALDAGLKHFHYLASTPEQPFGIWGGRVYLREIEFKEKNKTWFCNHYLVDLYPKLR